MPPGRLPRLRRRIGSTSAVIAAGLTFRPLAETVRGRGRRRPTQRARPGRETELSRVAARVGLLRHALSRLGAKPGAGSSSTSRQPCRLSRFASLKAALDPADGLWIAWPKKAAKIDGDLTFGAVQEVGLAHGLVDNKSCSIDGAGRRSRFVYRLTPIGRG